MSIHFELHDAINAAIEAGTLILSHYHATKPCTQVDIKSDDSPVTPADIAAHNHIVGYLSKVYPGIPVLSEEGEIPPYSVRKNWNTYFLVDPLDGTKGFIKRNGDFTVNIALLRNHQPVAGIIYLPVSQTLYFGSLSAGAYRQHRMDKAMRIHTQKKPENGNIVVLQSRTQNTPKLDAFMGDTPHARICAGSSIKFCLLAEGSAHLFPCLHPTWEWDTAAGQAILEAAGGSVTQINGSPMQYTKESPLNEHFVARS